MATKTIKKTVRRGPTKKVGVKKTSKKSVSKKSTSKKSTVKKTGSKRPVKKAVKRTASVKPRAKSTSKKSKALPIVGLLINILILPGLGTLIGGGSSRKKSGIIQLILSIIALALIFSVLGMFIGIPLWFAMWIWSIVVMAKAI